MRLMDALRFETARQRLLRALAPHAYPHEFPAENYRLFVDIVRAAVRQANNQRSFATVRQFLLLSQHYCSVDARTGAHSFVYAGVRSHEAFSNSAFWEANFMDVSPSEQRRANSSGKADKVGAKTAHAVAAWHALDDVQRYEQNS